MTSMTRHRARWCRRARRAAPRSRLGDGRQLGREFGQRDRGFLKEQRAILLNGDGDGLGGGIHLLASVLGSSIGTPTVISGAATMKTMSSTSMTSTTA